MPTRDAFRARTIGTEVTKIARTVSTRTTSVSEAPMSRIEATSIFIIIIS